MARLPIALLAIALTASGCASSSVAISADARPSPWVLRDPVVDPSATVIHLLVSERDCASGMRADDRIRHDLTQNDAEVVITAKISPLGGDVGCPGNPFTPLAVTLAEPIGDRELVDGSGETDASLDHAEPPGPAPTRFTEPSFPPITPATTLTSQDGFYIEPRCEVAEDSFEDRFASGTLPDGFFARPEHVVAALADGFELSEDGWHLVESTDQFGQLTQSWTQYLNGIPKAAVLAHPTMNGWQPALSGVCDLGGPWTPDAQPPPDREVTPLTASTSTLADVSTALAQVPSLSGDSSDWRFASEDTRCTTWIELEDALERTGHSIQSLNAIETTGESQRFQIRLSVVNEAGEFALLSTSGADGITIASPPVAQLSAEQLRLRRSFLSPCWLDTPIQPDSE